MELPVTVGPMCQPPALSPLALGRSESLGLDGWDCGEEEFELENLFRDAEAMGNDGNQPPAPAGGGGDMSDIDLSPQAGCLGRDVHSLAEATSTVAGQQNPVGDTAEEMNHTVSEDDTSTLCPRNAWSTTSVSSDEGSSCTLGSFSPASGPIRSMLSNASSSSGTSMEAPKSVTTEASTGNVKSRRLLAVSSGATTPILPFTFAPGFGGASNASAAAAAAFTALPALNFGGVQAVAGQAWKRLRGGEDGSSPGAECGQASAGGMERGAAMRLLSGGGDGSAGMGRINKRAKREERLMKNREAANRSRVKRKEVLSELENRAEALSSSLAASREEAAALKQEIASLREQNSFLRGMLCVQGSAIDLPPVVPSASTASGGGGVHRGASAPAAGASAIIGAVGTGLAVISCVALSAAGFGGSGSNVGGSASEHRAGYGGGIAESSHAAFTVRGGFGNAKSMGGRRMLLSIDENNFYPADEKHTLLAPNGGVGVYVLVGLAIAFAMGLLFLSARWTYRKMAARRSVAVPRRRTNKGRGSGFDYLGGIWPVGRLLGGNKPVRKLM